MPAAAATEEVHAPVAKENGGMNAESMPYQPIDEKKESPSAEGCVPNEIASMEGATHMMNGMPPSQVYVDTNHMGYHAMMGLDAQFQALGVNDPHDSSNHESSDGNDVFGEESSGEDPVKLFIGQVPRQMSEEDIFPTFDPFGPLKDVAIIRDKNTGLHRGCAFVTYWSGADAERAQEALHDKFTFPGAKRAAQVKPAEPQLPENKLFIGMLSRTAGEEEVKELFAPFGEIREVFMIRNADGSSKCAAFLRYVKREAAVKAIDSLHNNIVMDGAARPLIVKFADNQRQRQQRQIKNLRRHEMIAMGAYPGYGHLPMGMALANASPYAMPPQYTGANGPPPYMYPPHQFNPHAYAYQQPSHPDSRPANPRPREGPAGANLFVYHLPHDLTDADLATAFNPFGNVISAKVYVDKFTGESKGFGFVSYDSVISAESAIEQMNGFQIGTKRLKVQHKRVHNHNGPRSQQPLPHMAPTHNVPVV